MQLRLVDTDLTRYSSPNSQHFTKVIYITYAKVIFRYIVIKKAMKNSLSQIKQHIHTVLALNILLSFTALVVFINIMTTSTLSILGDTIRVYYPWLIFITLFLSALGVFLIKYCKGKARIIASLFLVVNLLFLSALMFLYMRAVGI